MSVRFEKLAYAKILLFLLALLPLASLIYGVVEDSLGANPVEVVTRASGEWALRFLLLTLTMTPLRLVLKQAWPLRLRRMLGLFCYFYVCIHLLCYLWLDQFFDWGEIIADIFKRPFITAGMLAFLLLTPLALTSTRAMMRRLGRHWQRLHRLVYLIAGLAVLHYFWLVKADTRLPVVYLLILIILLSFRLTSIRTKLLALLARTK